MHGLTLKLKFYYYYYYYYYYFYYYYHFNKVVLLRSDQQYSSNDIELSVVTVTSDQQLRF